MELPLRPLLKDIVLKSPKKFSLHFVVDVFPHIKSSLDIDDLLECLYFQKVAWRFFHADVTNNHLQLVLLIAHHELELNSTETWDLMAADPQKFQHLLERVLQVTMNTSDTNVALRGAAFLFLGGLVRINLASLQNCKLYEKWLGSVFEVGRVANVLNSNDDVKCFLHFCMCCAVVLDEYKQKIAQAHVPLYFTHVADEMGAALTTRLGHLLSIVLHAPTDFVGTQLAFKEANLGARFDFCVLAMSRLDVSHSELFSALEQLELAELANLATKLGIVHAEMPKLPLAETIVQTVLGPRISPARISTPDEFTEGDIFDVLEDLRLPQLYFRPILPLTASADVNTVILGEQSKLAQNVMHQVHQHLVTTLDRLTIVNGNHDDGIKGKSKYFRRIESATISGPVQTLTLKGTIDTSVCAGGAVVLLEICKPITSDERPRIRKFGIQGARMARVVADSEGSQIRVRAPRKVENTQFNAVVILPDLVDVASLGAFCDAAKCVKLKSPVFAKLRWVDNESAEEETTDKKAENTEKTPDEKKTENTEKTAEKKPESPERTVEVKTDTSGREKDTSVHSPAQNVLVFLGDKNSGQEAIVNRFLEELAASRSQEKCLVVLPSRAAVSVFPLTQLAKSKCAKFGDPESLYNVETSKKAALERVSDLAATLHLQEYAFDCSAENALMLYETHIVPKWNAYLGQLQKTHDSVERYPFRKFEFSGQENLRARLEAVANHYAGVKLTFALLQQLLPLDKVELLNNVLVFKYLAKKAPYVLVSIDDLASLYSSESFENAFENIVTLTSAPETWIALLRNRASLQRLMVFSKPQFAGISKWPRCVPIVLDQNMPSLVGLRGETQKAGNSDKSGPKSPYNPGLKFTAQHIPVLPENGTVNVHEARYIVHFYQYLRLLGYPHNQIVLVVKSPFMRLLIDEILDENKINGGASDLASNFRFGYPIFAPTIATHAEANVPGCDYVIASTHPAFAMGDYTEVAKAARRGLYVFGAKCTSPYKLRSGELQVHTGVRFQMRKDAREETDAYVIEGPDHLGEYVEQMTNVRTGKSR